MTIAYHVLRVLAWLWIAVITVAILSDGPQIVSLLKGMAIVNLAGRATAYAILLSP